MRVTNTMVFNASLNNIWRNARHLNNLVTQIETTQKIQRPSEDPMIANRALRYRTILSEAEQFKSNNERGLAWMEVTESSFLNLLVGTPSNPSILQRMHNRLLQAAQTGTNYIENHRGMINEMAQFLYQMTRIEMNQSYMGRYVFSGFHTDEPPVLHADRPNARYVIQQTFNRNDIDTTIAFHRSAPHLRPTTFEGVNIINLPFTNVDFGTAVPGPPPSGGTGGAPALGIFLPPIPPATTPTAFPANIYTFNSLDEDAYNVPNGPDDPPTIHHVRDTGELILNEAAKALFRDGVTINFQKNGLQEGELNPRVYFPSWDLNNNGHHFNAAQQNIQLEISANTHMTINSHASNVVTDKLFADMRRLIDFVNSLQTTDPLILREFYSGPPNSFSGDELEEAVSRFLSDELGFLSGMIHDRIDNMIESLERHINQAQHQHTNLGSRMNRLDMVQIRLEEDEIAYTALLSETIDTDIAGTIVRKNGAEAAFQNALFAISRATQLSLADFINR